MLNWKCTIALTGLCLTLASCGAIKDSLKKRYFEEGMKHHQERKFREAALAFRKAIQKDSEFGEAYYRLGLSELEPGGSLERAMAALRRATILLPYHLDSKIRLAEIYIAAYLATNGIEKVPLQEAKNLAQLLVTRNPKSHHGLRLSGHIAALEQRHHEAVEFFRKADALKPGETAVRLPLAQALAADGQNEAAQKLLLEIVAQDKACYPAYDLLYAQYMQAKRPGEAEALLKARTLELPRNAEAVLRLAGHYFRAQKTREMDAALARLADAKAFPQGRLTAGDFYRNIGNLAAARQQYQAGLGLNGRDQLEHRKRLASLLLLEGKRDEAIEAYEGVAKQLPQDQESRETRASLLLERDVDAALKEFEALVRENPNNPMLRYNLGQAYLAKRNLGDARVNFLESSRRHRTFLLPRMALAQMSLEANQFKEVRQYANDILTINPASPEGKFYSCAALTGLGEYREARRELKKLLEEYPKYAEVRLQLAFVDMAERRYAEAEAALRALYESSRDVRALNGLVAVYLGQEQSERALNVVSEELKKHPESQRIRLLLAQTALRLRKFALAVEHFVELAEVEPNWDYLYLRIGEAYQASGDLARAVAAYRKARQLSPKSLEPALRLAYAFEVAAQYKEAISGYREVLALNPDVPIAMNNLAYLLAEYGGNLDEALRLAEAALQRLPQQQHISDTIGWITLRKKQTDAAMQIFASLVRKYPAEPIYRYHLAVAHYERGDQGRARVEAQSALERKPSQSDERKIRALMARLR